ncbi:aquaporin AQPAe.a isoform X1 [Schistocerca nitens]|uniref:aquaporin AQPAe.a isoform X1 n=1 Tax=Schistocerca nitens TaxID=7011 RepID=UPI0021195EAF|nr:aquaporin AQPAe.a isoform X1 [Schistocerca nitens]
MAGGFKERLGIADITDKNGIWKCLLAEFIGTLLLNFFGCGSCVYAGNVPGAKSSQVLIALTFGLVIMAIVQIVGHVSGAHVNPAVTAGMLVTGNITILKGLLYIIAQCVGSITGSAILKALTPPEKAGSLGLTNVAESVTPVQGFGVEFFLGFVLVLVVFGVCDVNKPESKGFAPLVIGLTIAMGHMAAVDYTGSSMNPARTLGSAVIANEWENHWVYWLGPILGGIAAALLYKNAFAAPSADVNMEYSPVQVQDKELKRLDNRKDEDGMA